MDSFFYTSVWLTPFLRGAIGLKSVAIIPEIVLMLNTVILSSLMTAAKRFIGLELHYLGLKLAFCWENRKQYKKE